MEIKEKNLGKVCVTVDGDWSVSRDYDKLCIVYNGETNASYISKKYIPKGIDIKDSEYWQRFTKPVEVNVEDIDVDIRYKLPFNVGNSSGNFNINQSQYNDILQAASEGKLIEVNNIEIKELMKNAQKQLDVLGYTEHSLRHVSLVSERAGEILKILGYDEHRIELAKIAGYMHDIGNCINRSRHAEYGALLANELLEHTDM